MLSTDDSRARQSMKTIVLTVCLACALAWQVRAEPPAVVVSDSDTLSLRDLNMRKWSFVGTPAPGQLVTVRKEEFHDGKLCETSESIADTMNQPRRESIVLIDRSFFSDTSDNHASQVYQIAGVFNTPARVEEARLHGFGGVINGVEIEFEIPRGRIKYVFTMLVENYEDVKKRISDLRPMIPHTGWTIETNWSEKERLDATP